MCEFARACVCNCKTVYASACVRVCLRIYPSGVKQGSLMAQALFSLTRSAAILTGAFQDSDPGVDIMGRGRMAR